MFDKLAIIFTWEDSNEIKVLSTKLDFRLLFLFFFSAKFYLFMECHIAFAK